ncbi:MAG: NAD(P)/FAD-dependent oxidoreductase [Myxococcota bacterium]
MYKRRVRVVIIGNGVAGMEAALVVKSRQPDWDLTIVSEESDHFFSRTALMWVFTGQLSHRCIEPLERGTYERLGIRRVRARATGIDAEGRQVEFAGGLDPVPFDQLIIACGSRPRPFPLQGSDAAGVGHFVTHQDLSWLEKEIVGGPSKGGPPPRPEAHVAYSMPDSPYLERPVAAAKRGRLAQSPAVVGGGLIGIEAVEVMVNRGLKPKFFIREEYFWPIAIEPRESTWISERMREHGVDVRLHDEIDSLRTADGVLTGVKTKKGEEIDVDCLVVAIGVMPNTDWLQNGPIELDRRGGILVGEDLQTNVEGVYACGDCASVAWFDGSKRPEQLWYTGRDQGRVAGRRVCGERATYKRPIWYNSAKLMDVEYTTAGIVNMKVEREQNWFFEETGKVRSTTRIVVQDGRVIGFNFLGRRWDHDLLNEWIVQRRTLEWVLDNLEQARFDTEFVPPLRIPEPVKRQPLEETAKSPVPGPTVFNYA